MRVLVIEDDEAIRSVLDRGLQAEGFDVDLCRALAAAVLGDAGKVRYVSLNANDRFAATSVPPLRWWKSSKWRTKRLSLRIFWTSS